MTKWVLQLVCQQWGFALALIGKFSNRKRAAPMNRPSKKSKSESFEIVGHLPEFSATHARCTLCSSKKIENRTFIQEYFMNL